MTIIIDKWEVNDMAPTYSRMTQPLYEVRSGIYTSCDEEIDFIVELVHEIERLQWRVIQLENHIEYLDEEIDEIVPLRGVSWND